jgi:hypothetical protein
LDNSGPLRLGKSFEWGQDKRDIRTQWNTVDKVYQGILDNRQQHPEWPFSFIVDGTSGHFECSPQLTQYFARYIDLVAKARLSDDGTIKPLDLTKGFVTDLPVPSHEGQPVKQAAAERFPAVVFRRNLRQRGANIWRHQLERSNPVARIPRRAGSCAAVQL